MKTSFDAIARVAKRFAAAMLVLGGATASAAMLAVMLSLSAQLARATFPATNVSELKIAPTSAGPDSGSLAQAAPKPETPKTDESANNSVANAMTAVSTAVAAVTLILSVGTTWFALKLNDVDKATQKLKETDEAYEQRLAEISKALSINREEQVRREQGRQLLVDARFALRQWTDQSGAAMTRYSVFADLSAHLEMLMSTSLEQRQRSFDELTRYLPDEPGFLLAPVNVYAKHCHAMHGGDDRIHGLWCDLFSSVEHAAHLRLRPTEKPMY